MKPILFILFLFLIPFASFSQVTFHQVKLFNANKIDLRQLEKLPSNVHLDLNKEGFNFQEVQLTSQNFSVTDSKNKSRKVNVGRFYQDKTRNATLSVFGKEIVLLYDSLEVTNRGKKSVQIRVQSNFPFSCYTDDDSGHKSALDLNSVGNLPVCRSVQIYFECDYKLYTDKGSSITNVTNYVTALFNQIALLYANEQIPVQISQIKVWNTPDPYIPQTSISGVLNKFRSDLNGNFNGNLAHLLSTRSLGGGIAYVDVLCFKQYGVGVSAITSTFQNVPTYSWSVEVVTHELGHNLGSWHTQSCNWPGGAIDGCYSPEGSCPRGPNPINGGTIMSYCHLTNFGINFNNGFGPLPGNLIRSKFNSATCLSGTSLPPSGLNYTNLTQTSVKLQWNVISGSIYQLQWKKTTDSQWNVISGLTSPFYDLSGLVSSAQYDWKVKTDCSTFSTIGSFITLPNNPPPPACQVITNVTFANITQTSFKVNWPIVSGAITYSLQYKKTIDSNWIEYSGIPSNSLTLNNLVVNMSYQVKVRPDCNPGFSSIFQIQTLPNSGGNCSIPINLQTTNLTGTSATLTWSAVLGATSYKISLKFPGSSHFTELGQTFINPTVNFYGFELNSTYQWKVKANCSNYSNPVSFTTLSNIIRPVQGSFQIGNKIIVFPNPGRDVLNVFGNSSIDFKIFDIQGKLQKSDQLRDGEINISELCEGMYLLNIDNQWIKFVKE